MPLRSEAQRRFLHAAEGRGDVPAGLAEKYENATPKSVKAKLPMHVKKHATVADLMKAAEPDPDRDRQADDEGQMQTDKDRKDDEPSENYYGHGAGVKGKKMNTVKDLLKKKAEDTGAALGGALQGVRDNAKKTMGAIKPPATSLPPPPKPMTSVPGMPAEKKAEDAGGDIGSALQGVRDNAKKTMGAIKPTPAQTPPPAVKMGPPQGMRATPPMGKAASAFTNMPNRKDGMFFTKSAGRKDGMFFKQAMAAVGAGRATTGDARASNAATGAVGSGMGHGKGVKVPAPKKAKAA